MPIRYDEQYVKRPRSEYDYTEEEVLELQKCSESCVHFIKYVKIVNPDLGEILFNPYDYQLELLQKFQDHRFNIGLCSRQSGKTTIVGSYVLWYAMFNRDKVIGIVSNKEKAAKMILDRIKRTYEQLPTWLKPGVTEYSKTFIAFENGTKIVISATSADAFRGETINLLVCDEFAFVPGNQAEDFWSANYPTISASKQSKIIIISTPNGLFNIFHRIYLESTIKQNTFINTKVSWERVPGRDKAWAAEQLRNLGKRQFAQEFAVEFIGSTNTLIEPETLEIILNQSEEPIHEDLNGRLRLWEKPVEGAIYIIGCLPPNEKVLTNNGLKSIKDVILSDKLIDEKGNFTSIKNIQLYKNIDDDIYKIKTYGSYRSTTFTKEHPIYISHNPPMKRKHGCKRYRDFNFEFDKAENVKCNDWLCYPNIYKNKPISEEDIKNKWNKYENITRKDFIINDNIILDEDFWWFIGMWLGDGWIQNHGQSYTIHTCHDIKTEYEFAHKVKNIFNKYNRSVIIFDKNSCVNTVFSSKQIHSFLTDNFGEYSHGKTIPEWVKYLPNKYKLQLIKGYIDSDGCLYETETFSSFSITSISLNLLEGIQDILFSLGFISRLKKCNDEKTMMFQNREVHCRKKYQLNLSNYDTNQLSFLIGYKCKNISKRNRNIRYCHFSRDKNYIYFRVKSVTKKKYQGDVYNFETDSHTFLCRHITTHNCDPAKGTGENYSTAQILKLYGTKPVKMEQVGVFHDNMTDIYDYSDILVRLGMYYNKAYLLVENNGEGSAVVNRIWWTHEYENLVNSGSKTKNLGIRSTGGFKGGTKPKAVLLMKKLIEDGSLRIYDERTLKELGSFIEENGRFFGKDTHDDLVSAMFWGCYFLEMKIIDDQYEFIVKEEDDDIWGVLTDLDQITTDWSWLTDSNSMTD